MRQWLIGLGLLISIITMGQPHASWAQNVTASPSTQAPADKPSLGQLLGLSPRTPTANKPAAPAPATPATKNPPATVPPPTASAPAVQAVAPSQVPTQLSQPAPAMGAAANASFGQNFNLNNLLPSYVRAMLPENLRKLDFNNINVNNISELTAQPTNVFDSPVAPFAQNPARTDLPNRLTVALERWQFGPNDLQSVQTATGFSAAEIQQQCRLSFNGSFMTNKGFYNFDQGLSRAAVTGYAEPFRSLTITPVAVCAAPRQLPRNAGFVIRHNGALIIPLMSRLNCDFAQPVPVSNLTIRINYAGDGVGQCRLQ